MPFNITREELNALLDWHLEEETSAAEERDYQDAGYHQARVQEIVDYALSLPEPPKWAQDRRNVR